MLEDQLIPEVKERTYPRNVVQALMKAAFNATGVKEPDLKASMKQSVGLESGAEAKKRMEEEEQEARSMKIHIAVAALTVMVSAAAIISSPNIIVFLAMIFPLSLAPYVVVQRERITKLGERLMVINQMRSEANRLDQENKKLTSTIKKLEIEVRRLLVCENRLKDIVERQGFKVKTLRSLVKEHNFIQDQMTDVIKSSMMEDMIRAIMASDKEGDFYLEKQEIETMLLRLKYLNGMKFDANSLWSSLLEHSITENGKTKTPVSFAVDISKSIMADDSFVARNSSVGNTGV